LAMLSQNPAVTVVLTDVVMPEMTGPEMVADLRARGIALPVIFVTGFAGDGAEAGLLDGEHVLRKPFTLSQLDRMIARAVASARPGDTETEAQSGPARPDGIAFSA
jgi:CheY-like chemotaxis protein